MRQLFFLLIVGSQVVHLAHLQEDLFGPDGESIGLSVYNVYFDGGDDEFLQELEDGVATEVSDFKGMPHGLGQDSN